MIPKDTTCPKGYGCPYYSEYREKKTNYREWVPNASCECCKHIGTDKESEVKDG